MLGNRASARKAFRSILHGRGYANEQLSSPAQTNKNDITCLKYCVYLKDIAADSLTLEENEFMKTMEEIDVWYDNQMNQAKLEGEERQKQSIALKMLGKNIPLETIAEVTGLTVDRLQELQTTLSKIDS